ncbi:hypothetical protein IFR05_015645 [Cadophora sp. M221]|nr:hypothetical protein IFR05_015645 [Cadophora sp. M221]
MSSAIESLSLPPTGFYTSFDALFDAAQAYAANAWYASTTERSTKKHGRVIKTLSCKKGGHAFKPTIINSNRKPITPFDFPSSLAPNSTGTRLRLRAPSPTNSRPNIKANPSYKRGRATSFESTT